MGPKNKNSLSLSLIIVCLLVSFVEYVPLIGELKNNLTVTRGEVGGEKGGEGGRGFQEHV